MTEDEHQRFRGSIQLVVLLSTVAGIVAVVAVVFAILGWAKIDGTVNQIQSESAERRDQSCTISERAHKDDVEALRRTYAVLTDPKMRALLGPGLTKLVEISLPEAERKAGGRPPNRDGKVYNDPAPAFCDEPNVGLPEPDPVLPVRPPGLTVPRR